MFWRPWVLAVAVVAAAALGTTAAQAGQVGTAAKSVVRTTTVKAEESYAKPKCGAAVQLMCAEVNDYKSVFPYYVGHDEPSVEWYSNVPGSGNRMRYQFTLPREPSPKVINGRSWTFQLTPAIWFGMAMCDTQSYPLQVSTEAAFEADLPRIEQADLGGICNRFTGANCTLLPRTDDGQPANFYPFFSITGRHHEGSCRWFLGNDVPGLTASDFGGLSQYGALYPLNYLVFGGHGAIQKVFDDFHQNLGGNPCPAESR